MSISRHVVADNVCYGITGPADWVHHELTHAPAGVTVHHGHCKDNGHCKSESEGGITETECMNYDYMSTGTDLEANNGWVMHGQMCIQMDLNHGNYRQTFKYVLEGGAKGGYGTCAAHGYTNKIGGTSNGVTIWS